MILVRFIIFMIRFINVKVVRKGLELAAIVNFRIVDTWLITGTPGKNYRRLTE